MSPRGDIAIIGMACVFPKAPDVGAFWENILGKVDAMTEAPPDWSTGDASDPRDSAGDPVYTKRGGFLGELARFNPLDYGVLPRAIDGGDPEHFIALRVAHEALADAGYLDREFNRERTAVILGRGAHPGRGYATVFQHTAGIDQTIRLLATLHPEHSAAELAAIRQQLRASLPPFDLDTAPGLIPSVMCGRIANRLDLMGPAYTVDAACAGSLVAMEQASSKLDSGEVDMALAGGVHLSSPFAVALFFCQMGAMSRGGQVRSFGADADGALLGEGAGILVLKRREDAERDDDRIYALLKAVGVASDGRAMGLLAPRVEGEELAMRRAYEQSGIAPRTLSLVEGCGIGTPAADAVEIEALSRVFGERGGDGPSCALGSVKSMIGHPLPAGGAAGIIKAALALHHRVLPPTLHAEAGNPRLDSTPFYLNTEARPWIHAGPEPRRAAVSAFGLGGINAHAILEEHPGGRGESPQLGRGRGESPQLGRGRGERSHRSFGTEVLVLSAGDRGELLKQGDQLRGMLAENPDLDLVDLAYTLNCGLPAPPEIQLAIVADSVADLDAKLAHALNRLADPGCSGIDEPGGVYCTDAPLHAPGTLAFLFPGQGAQYVNMLADLCLRFPDVRGWFDLTDRAFAQHGRRRLPSQAIFPAPGERSPGDPDALWTMDSCIAAVLAANQALSGMLNRLAIRPDAVLGHSTGALSALGVAGAVHVDDEAELVRHTLVATEACERLHAEGRVPTGVLLAVVTAERERVLALVQRSEGALTVAMDNCPHQIVLGGCAQAVAAVADELGQAGAMCTTLPVDRAYHTPALTEVSECLHGFSEHLQFRPPQLAVYSCVTAARCPSDPTTLRRLTADECSRPVRFREAVEAMYADGVRIFVEAGPGGKLTGFVGDILRGREHLAVPADVAHRGGVAQLAHLVGLLAAHHVPMDLGPLYARRSPRRLSMEEGGTWEAQGVGGRLPTEDDRSVRLALDLPVLKLNGPLQLRSHATAGTGAVAPDVSGTSGREQVMRAYLDTMDRFLDVQRDTMRALLGSGGDITGGDPAPLIHENGVGHAPSPREPEPSPAVPPKPTDLARTVLGVVSERTGYPEDSLDLSADMEADLGLDSIKRVEILGALQQEHGLLHGGDMERLTGVRTLGQLIDALRSTGSEWVPSK